MAKLFQDVFEQFKLLKDGITDVTAPVKGLTSQSLKASDSLDDFGAALEAIEKRGNTSAKEMASVTGSLGRMFKTLGVIGASAKVFGDDMLNTNDAIRMAIRGTASVGRTAEETQKSVMSLQEYSLDLNRSLGENSAKLSATLANEFERNSNIDFKQNRDEIDAYTETMGKAGRVAGVNADQWEDFNKRVLGDFNLGLKDTSEIARDVASLSSEFGLSGMDAMQALNDHAEEIMAVDEAGRAAFIKDQFKLLALQRGAALDFKKYTSSLSGDKGISALGKRIRIAALTGIDQREVDKAFLNPNDKEGQSKILLKLAGSFSSALDTSMEEIQKIADKQKSGTSTESENFTMAKWSEVVTKQMVAVGADSLGSVDAILGLTNKLKEMEKKPSLDRASVEAKLKAGNAAQLDPSWDPRDSLQTTEELTMKFKALTQSKVLEGLGSQAHRAIEGLRYFEAAMNQYKNAAAAFAMLGGLINLGPGAFKLTKAILGKFGGKGAASMTEKGMAGMATKSGKGFFGRLFAKGAAEVTTKTIAAEVGASAAIPEALAGAAGKSAPLLGRVMGVAGPVGLAVAAAVNGWRIGKIIEEQLNIGEKLADKLFKPLDDARKQWEQDIGKGFHKASQVLKETAGDNSEEAVAKRMAELAHARQSLEKITKHYNDSVTMDMGDEYYREGYSSDMTKSLANEKKLAEQTIKKLEAANSKPTAEKVTAPTSGLSPSAANLMNMTKNVTGVPNPVDAAPVHESVGLAEATRSQVVADVASTRQAMGLDAPAVTKGSNRPLAAPVSVPYKAPAPASNTKELIDAGAKTVKAIENSVRVASEHLSAVQETNTLLSRGSGPSIRA